MWHSSEGIIMKRPEDTNQQNKIENSIFRIAFRSPRGQWFEPLSELMLTYCQLDPKEHISMASYLKLKYLHSRKCVWICRLRNCGHLFQGGGGGGWVNWKLRNKLLWNFNHNSNIVIQENTFENIVCAMVGIFSRPQCVKISFKGIRRLYCNSPHGPLARYVKLRVAHSPGISGTFSPPPLVTDPETHQGTCVTHVPWCMPGSLTSGFLWSQWWGKRSRHSRRMHNPQFYVSGKRPMITSLTRVICTRERTLIPDDYGQTNHVYTKNY